MIRVVFCDTSALSYGCAMRTVKERTTLSSLSFGRDEARARDSASAYIMLDSLLKALCGTEGAVTKDEYGKPHIEGTDIEISLSHRRGVCLIAFSDEGKIGADIETVADERIIRGIEERYLSKLDFLGAKVLDVELYFSAIDAEGNVDKAVKITDIDNNNLHYESVSIADSPWYAWCALEAALKKDGRGFGALPSVQADIDGSNIMSARIGYGGISYALAVCR